MKTVIAIAIALSSLTASAAIDASSASCQGLRAAVARNGFQNVTTGGKTYTVTDLYANGGKNEFCAQWENSVTLWAPTADAKACPVGLVCQDKSVNGAQF